MKAVQEQQQPNSMDSSDSVTGSNEYAYRPLITKHRRAGSTGTTGDEEYTTDEDEIYGDETDCTGSIYAPHPILKSDLARAATDLFGYATKPENCEDEPTSLFDEDDVKFCRESSSKPISLFTYNENHVTRPALAKRRTSNCNTDENAKTPTKPFADDGSPLIRDSQLALENSKTLDRRLIEDAQLACGNTEDAHIAIRDELKAGEIQPEKQEQQLVDSRKSSSNDERADDADAHIEKISNNESEIKEGSPRHESPSSPSSPTHLHWEKAVAEVKEQYVSKLQADLQRAHEELKLKDEEVGRLSRIRQDVEAELEELTASLFQEAHNMVREANTRQAAAERLLEESRMKSEVLAAEVAALKTLVLTSTPARPNPHLHPQIDTRCRNGDDGQSGIFAKKHRRSPSHFNLKYGRENSPPDSPQKEQRTSLPCEREAYERECEKEREREREREREKERERESRDLGPEVDPRVHAEFLHWKANPCVDKGEPFVERIFREDIDLCLDFTNAELGAKVRQAVLDGIIFIEAVSDKAKLAFPKKCALLEAPRQCHYRMRLGDQEKNQWYSISQICRNRIIAVCDFLNYLRYVERGLVKSSVHDVYWEITRLRKEMVLARLGLPLST